MTVYISTIVEGYSLCDVYSVGLCVCLCSKDLV